MSVAHIAALANMSHVTWARIENGERVQPGKLAAVDRVLHWEPGTCEAILAGEDPPLPDPRIAEIMRSQILTPEEKAIVIEVLPPRREPRSRRESDTA